MRWLLPPKRLFNAVRRRVVLCNGLPEKLVLPAYIAIGLRWSLSSA